MSIKDQVLDVLEKSRQTELEFLEGLLDTERSEAGQFQNWSAKDVIAHASYWNGLCATRVNAWIQEGKVKSAPHFERANKETYEAYADSSWDEVLSLSERAHGRLVDALQEVGDDDLLARSYESEGRKLWQSIVQTAYSHKLTHLADYYAERGLPEKAARLWGEWAQLVSPLDTSPAWQGAVHYNAACSLALAGESDNALKELRRSLELQPALKPWSRHDPDLESLHGTPEFKEMFASQAWWRALESGPMAEALADQFMRSLLMLREAIRALDDQGWRQGETDYLRPAGLTLHIAQIINMYSSLGSEGEASDPLLDVDWENPEASALPSQEALLASLDRVEEKLAAFLSQADLGEKETQYPWTGSTMLSRAVYCLRHTQHHLADLASELQRRGFEPPGWA
ncbi:MAG: TPR end-of-group domain-containing protein [Anaerolineales bacterium]